MLRERSRAVPRARGYRSNSGEKVVSISDILIFDTDIVAGTHLMAKHDSRQNRLTQRRIAVIKMGGSQISS